MSAVGNIIERYRFVRMVDFTPKWPTFVAETWLRCFVTVMFLMWGAFECDDIRFVYGLCLAGIIIDVIRNVTLEHLRLGPDKMLAKLTDLVRHGNRDNREHWRIAVLAFTAVTVGYGMQYILVCPKSETSLVPQTVLTFLPLQDFTSHLSTTIRHFRQSLREHGYPSRAVEIGHIYMVGIWAILLYIALFTGMNQEISYPSVVDQIKKRFIIKSSKAIKFSFIMFLAMYSSLFAEFNSENCDWKLVDHTTGWHVFRSNISIMYFMFLCLFACSISTFMYLTLIVFCFVPFKIKLWILAGANDVPQPYLGDANVR